MRTAVFTLLLSAGCVSTLTVGGDEKPSDTRPEDTDGATDDTDAADPDTDTDTDGDGDTDGDTDTDGPIDADGDGVTVADGDCDDTDPETLPGGAEGTDADGVDQDCSGIADDVDACAFGAPADLQAAIDGTPEDFTLRVCAGTYTGAFTWPHPMTLLADEGPDVTFLVGVGDAPVVSIEGVRGLVGLVGFTVSGGVGVNGGGIVVTRAEVSLVDNRIEANLATSLGGGVYLERCSGVVSGNTVSGNTAGSGGGIVAWEGSVEIQGNEVLGNTATLVDETLWGKGAGGGGVLVSGAAAVIDNWIDGNEADGVAGGIYSVYGTGTISGNTVSNNHSVDDGGGILLNYASNAVLDNTIEGNVSDDDGGGVRVYVGVGAVISGNSFYSNAAGDDGGGMKLSHSTNTVTLNHFEGNAAGDAGGGLELDNETSHVTDCTFVGNTASRGAGLHSWQAEAPVLLERLTFESNAASACGGAIGIDNDPYGITFLHITAVDNTAWDGAAICLDKRYTDDEDTVFNDSYVTIQNSILARNVAGDDGGFFSSLNGHTSFVHVTAYDNAGGAFGGFSLEDSTVSFESSILADQDGPDFATAKEGVVVSTAAYTYTVFHDNDGGFVGLTDPVGSGGNVLADPLMVDPEAGDFTLTAASPAVDAGDPTRSDADGSRADAGAYGGPNGSW